MIMEDNENSIRIIKKHGEVMLHDGRKYHKKKSYKNGNVLWRCTNWRKLKCGGYVTVDGISVVRAIPHTLPCVKNVVQNEIDLTVHKCKDKIRKLDSRPIREIYDKFFCPLKNKGIDLVAEVPSLKSLKSALYKVRNESADIPKMCCSKVNEVEIPKSHLDFVMSDYLNVHEMDKFIQETQFELLNHDITVGHFLEIVK